MNRHAVPFNNVEEQNSSNARHETPKIKYSDTSANEDNSFRDHIR